MAVSMRNSCAFGVALCCACEREARESLSHMRNATYPLYKGVALLRMGLVRIFRTLWMRNTLRMREVLEMEFHDLLRAFLDGELVFEVRVRPVGQRPHDTGLPRGNTRQRTSGGRRWPSRLT